MTPHEIADLVDMSTSLVGGILVTLLGFRVIGKAKSMDAFYAKWGKHLRWLGPAWIVLTLIQHYVFT